jgi:hypothetical protein
VSRLDSIPTTIPALYDFPHFDAPRPPARPSVRPCLRILSPWRARSNLDKCERKQMQPVEKQNTPDARIYIYVNVPKVYDRIFFFLALLCVCVSVLAGPGR